MTLISILLISLATARLTRVVTSDVITRAPREWLLRALVSRERHTLAYLVVCDWCASVYVGVGVAGAWYAWGETMWFMATAAALSASHVTGFLADKTEAGD